MKKILSLIHLTILILFSLTYVYSDSVCTEKLLIEELKQDIRDNGKLDCLRKPLEPRKDKPETEIEKKRRLEAAWDTGKILINHFKDCSFESDNDWLAILESKFGLKSGLFDKDGNPVDGNSGDQADMCELIRSIIGGGGYEGVRLDDLKETVFDNIDCPGDDLSGETEVCAATGGSAAQTYSWTILLEGGSIKANELPKWELDPTSKDKISARKVTA